jgi:hypothetical protein
MPIVSAGPGGPPAVPAPPDPDPEHRFRDAPLGTRRTAVWGAVAGAALVVFAVPFVFPTGDTGDGHYPSLAAAVDDTVAEPGSWPLSFSGLDARCEAPDPQPGTGGLYATCDGYDLDIIGIDGVDDAVHSARRAMRSVWGTGTDHLGDVRFTRSPTASSGAAQATGADAVWVSEPVGFTDATDDGPDGFGGFDDAPGSGSGGSGGGGFSPVQYGDAGSSDETWVVAAALEHDGGLYTVMASTDSSASAALAALQETLDGISAGEDGDRA